MSDAMSDAMPSVVPTRSRSMLRIFLSCTSKDLENHRAAVRAMVDQFDEHPVVMGDFGARDGDATAVSLERVRSCDVYVLLLGWRYGSIPAHETLSVTHLEYRAARDAGIPRLIFLSDPATEHDGGSDAVFPAAVRDPEHAALLRAFHDEVSHDRVIATFTTPDNAAAVVAPALYHVLMTIPPPGPRPPYRLAQRAPKFVGRVDELRQVCDRVRAGQRDGHSVLVAGMGGVGKSALAAEALALLAADSDAFPGGVTALRCDDREGLTGLTWLYDQLLQDWSVPLAPEQVAQAQAQAQTAGPDGPEAEAAFYERALQTRFRAFAQPTRPDDPTGGLLPALVLLDNVERDFPLARALATLSVLNITALVTAQHRPSVPRLSVQRLDVLDPAAAVQLFAERYRAQGGAWDDARDDDVAANKVVAYLGYLPLAIELQAARAALLQTSVADLAATLARDRSQGLLGDPLDATRNMRYSFEKSLKTLTPQQRTRFAALGLPSGPDWPRAVIERLLTGIQARGAPSADETPPSDGAPPPDETPTTSEHASARADLERFVALSLATLLPPDGRIRLHPLLREYAQKLWQAEPPATHAAGLRALLAGLLDLVTEHEHDFAILAREEELIVAALDQAQASHAAPQHVIAIVDALSDYLYLGGHWSLGMHVIQWQSAACRAVGDRAMEGTTLNNLGTLAVDLGQKEEARRYFEQALVIWREVGDRAGEGTTLNNLGTLAVDLGQPDEARRYYEQALVIHREVGDRAMEGTTLNNLGMLAKSLGQPDEARRYFEQALVIHREVGNRAAEGTTLNNLGLLANDLGQPDEARRYYEQALVIWREVGDRAGEGATLNNLGALANDLGQPDEARRYYEQALVIRREVGDRAGEGTTLNNLGSLARSLGQPEEARGYFEQALAIFQDIGAVDSARITAENLANLEQGNAISDPTPSEVRNTSVAEAAALPAEKASHKKWHWWPWRSRKGKATPKQQPPA